MKRPWQIWLIYALCLAPLVAGLAWLSLRVVRLDAAETAARRQQAETALQSEFEADVRLALRRLDLALAELLARESSWPHYAFRSYFRPPESPDGAPVPSPLLHRNAQYVKLYFQIDPAGDLTSPQLPDNLSFEKYQYAEADMTHLPQVEHRMIDLSRLVNRRELLTKIPEETVASEVVLAMNDTWSSTNLPMLPDPYTADHFAQAPNLNEPDVVPRQLEASTNAPPSQSAAISSPDEVVQQSRYQGQLLNDAFRNESDYQSRKRRIESYGNTLQQQVKNREWLSQGKVVVGQNADDPLQLSDFAEMSTAIEGVSRPVWIADELMLLRRVVAEGQTTIQGVWLDWPAIRTVLQQEVSELFPELPMQPIHEEQQVDSSRMLASAPILVNVIQPSLPIAVAQGVSPTMIALFVAWACLVVAAIAAAVLLAGVVSMSERRATFVSAVTHELRTPLTTFRMYAEMLSEGMVRDELQRKSYLETLRTEADRLYHLVENVLSYARLERGAAAAHRSETTVEELLIVCTSRLSSRAIEANMMLCIEVPPSCGDVRLSTDTSAVEQILFNLIDNACKYARDAEDRRIAVDVSTDRRQVRLSVTDYGPGISAKESAKLFRPFTKSARDAANSAPGVGLGLALCRRLARDLGGNLHVEPAQNDFGARFVLTLPR